MQNLLAEIQEENEKLKSNNNQYNNIIIPNISTSNRFEALEETENSTHKPVSAPQNPNKTKLNTNATKRAATIKTNIENKRIKK